MLNKYEELGKSTDSYNLPWAQWGPWFCCLYCVASKKGEQTIALVGSMFLYRHMDLLVVMCSCRTL